MTHALSLADRWNRYWYLESVELWLDSMPGRRRRAVLKELRDNLGEAAADVGMRAAIADLGRPRLLAARYLEQEPGLRPRWLHGSLAAGAVFGLWLYSTMFYTIGMLDALSAAGVERATTGRFLGTVVVAVSDSREMSAQFHGFPWLPVLVMVLAFLVAGRAWNALPHRSRASRSPLVSASGGQGSR